MENNINKKQISTEPYKGTRDFYPEDLAVQNFIFDKARQISENFGYEEYNTSVLEPTELYKAKSGDEIVNEQTYSFRDRGDRDVTLRPEMTPSVARLVAKKKRELTFPLRWYSIQNFFRYERPQKGRLREFWQLNADIFGVEGIEAEVEIISLGYEIMKSLGAKDEDFVIKINSRKVLKSTIKQILFSEEKTNDLQKDTDSLINKIIKLQDKKDKISKEEFEKILKEVIPNLSEKNFKIYFNFISEEINSDNLENNSLLITKSPAVAEYKSEVKELMTALQKLGIKTVFTPVLARGFDYYTGIVFEFFDTNPENNRALFGGGRYDNLLDIFNDPKLSIVRPDGFRTVEQREKVPAVGFGMGDVTIKDFLEVRGLLPKYQSKTDLSLCTLSPEYFENANQLADQLRKQGLNVAVNYSDKKIGDQIAIANKKKIPYVICIGEDEIKNKQYKLKNLQTGEEKTVTEKEIIKTIR